MLVLSLRHKTNDHLWFTFFHEAAHIVKHSKKMLFIEGLEGLPGDEELQADKFASDTLIPPSKLDELHALSRKQYLSKDDVAHFAESIGVAPGIVVGRMQKEEWLPWSHMNDLKVKYEWLSE
jgi:Zn-dependent peptidase ImmA (M78 family)